MVSCSKCNNVFDESFGVCPKCGTVYVKDAAPTPAVQQYMAFQNEGQLREKAAGKKSSKGKLIALMIVLCAVALIVPFIIQSINHTTNAISIKVCNMDSITSGNVLSAADAALVPVAAKLPKLGLIEL